MTVPEDRYIAAGNVKTRFWRIGKGSAVILLHGLAVSAEIWMHNVYALAGRHLLIVPDLAGFGRSDYPPPSFTPLDYPCFLENFMESLGIDRATIVGQSLGGGIALQYALKFPQRVERLVLVDSAGLGREVIWTLRLLSIPWLGEMVYRPTRLGVKLFFNLAVRNPGVITDDFIDLYHDLLTRLGAKAFLLRMVRGLVNLGGAKKDMLALVRENLDKIQCPTLLVWGERDRVLPVKHAYNGRERIPCAQLHIMKDCGHIPNLERPEEFNEVVLRFLESDISCMTKR